MGLLKTRPEKERRQNDEPRQFWLSRDEYKGWSHELSQYKPQAVRNNGGKISLRSMGPHVCLSDTDVGLLFPGLNLLPGESMVVEVRLVNGNEE